MSEEQAWEEAGVLNRELGNRVAGHPDPTFDDRIPEQPGGGFFVAREVAEGDWQAVFTREHETEVQGFFRRVRRGIGNVLGELIIRP